MLYLIRHVETGRDAQPGRRKLQTDIVSQLHNGIPEAQVSTDTGRIFVQTEHDARSILGELHGIISFSACARCELDELTACVLDVARQALVDARTFAVRVKCIGPHNLASQEIAARLGYAIQQRSAARVQLHDPDVFIGVEVRGENCYVFDNVVIGFDHRSDVTPPRGSARFVVDQMLGRLAVWLRLLGFDTRELPHAADSALLRAARAEDRILLTRDRALADARSAQVLLLKGEQLEEQLRETLEMLGLQPQQEQMFSRCTLCNSLMEHWSKQAAKDRVPPVVYALHDAFKHCPVCDKVYWPGDHHARILAILKDVLQEDS